MMEWQLLNDALWTFAQGLLIIALPILVKALMDWVSVKIADIREQMTQQQNWRIDEAIGFGVKIAEQLKKSGVLPGNEAAKAFCVDYLQKEFNRQSIELDLDLLSDKIEGAYHSYRLANKQ